MFKLHRTTTGGTDDTKALGDDIDRFQAQLSPVQQSVLDANVGTKSTPREQEYRAAVKVLADAGWFDKSEAAFAQWKSHLLAADLPPEDKAAVREWESPDGFRLWVQQDVAAKGFAAQDYTSSPWWRSWQNSYEYVNKDYVLDQPEANAFAVIWGYMDNVLSPEARDIYERMTGKPAPLPSKR